MSLESAIADLVSASTSLVSAVNVTKTTIEETEAAAAAQVQPAAASATEAQTQASAAATSAGTVSSKLATAAADYAAQKVTKGLAAVQTAADSELADRLHRCDPARYPFRGAVPSLVMDFVRQECHRNNAAGNLEPVDLNSFMTFTRASTATYTGPDGLLKTAGVNEPRYDYDPVTGEALGLLIEEQRTNLQTKSAHISSWTPKLATLYPADAIAPDGTLSAIKLTEDTSALTNHFARATIQSLSIGVYSFSVFLKNNGRRGHLHLETAPYTGSVGAIFDLANGTCTYTAVSAPELNTPIGSISAAGNGWYRCTLTFSVSAAASGVPYVITANSSNTDFYTGDGVSGLYLWGLQLEAGAFPTSYIPTPATFTGRASTATYLDANGVLQTAASGVARSNAYDYDADGVLRPVGLLLEKSATNLLTQSQNLVEWNHNCVSNFTRNYGDYLTPSGVMNGTRINFDSDSASTYGVYSSVSLNAGDNLTLSVYVKGLSGNKTVRLTSELTGGAFATTINVDFNLTTGSYSTPAGVRISSIPMANGWYRVSVTRTATGTGTSVLCLYSGSAGANEIVLYGAQAEIGNYATSYIPTTTAQVTRAADTATSTQVTRGGDVAASTLAADVYNMEAGTTCVEAIHSVNGSYPAIYGWLGDYFIFTDTTTNTLALNGRGSSGALRFSGPASGSRLRHVLCRSRTNLYGSVNGGTTSTCALTLSPQNKVTKLNLGTGGYYLNGYIRSLTYYPKLMSAADLQALTIL